MNKIYLLPLLISLIVFIFSTRAALTANKDYQVKLANLKKADNYVLKKVGADFFKKNIKFKNITLSDGSLNSFTRVNYRFLPLENYGKSPPLSIVITRDIISEANDSLLLPDCKVLPELCKFNLTADGYLKFKNIYHFADEFIYQPPFLLLYICPDKTLQLNYVSEKISSPEKYKETIPPCKK